MKRTRGDEGFFRERFTSEIFVSGRRLRGLLLAFTVLLACTAGGIGTTAQAQDVQAQDTPSEDPASQSTGVQDTVQNTEISGRVFGDYYMVAAHHNESIEGRNGLWFRRIYLTLERGIGGGWSIRLRGEMDQPGDFTSDASMTPEVKDAYLQWTGEQHVLQLGLASTPTWGLLEDEWGYRSVEKTPLDLYEFGSSRDIGLSLQGRLGEGLPVRYHAMIGNGSGTGTETDAGKKAMLSVAVSPISSVTAEAYGDIERGGQGSGGGGYYTLQGALYWRPGAGHLGIQYARQTRSVEDSPQEEPSSKSFDVFSVFGRMPLPEGVGALNANVFLRYDRQFQPNPAGDQIDYLPLSTEAPAHVVISGIDIRLHEQVRLMPNVETVFYEEAEGPTPDADVLPRLTFYYRF